MIRSELSPAYKFRANVRPVRHAYLISSRSSSQLARAMSYCCTQWGGIGNLIVPVTPSLELSPLDKYLLGIVEPDVVVSYLPVNREGGRARHERLQQRVAALWPERDVTVQTSDFERWDAAAHPLSMIPDDDLQSRQFIGRRFQGPASDRSALLALFGQVHEGQEEDYARLLRCGVSPVGLESIDLWQQQLSTDPFSSPIALTGYGVRPYRVEGSSLGVSAFHRVVVGDSVEDLCLFWNFRAIQSSTRFPGQRSASLLLLPYRLVNAEGLRGLAEAVRSAPSLEATSNLDLGVYLPTHRARRAWVRAIEQAGDFARLDEPVSWSLKMGTQPPEQVDRHGALTYQYLRPDLPVRFWEGVHHELPPMTTLAEGDNAVRIEPPPGFSNRFLGHHMLDLESEVWERYPKTRQVARAINDNARFTRYGVTFVSSISPKPSEFRFQLPSELRTLEAVFQGAGLTIRESDKTRYLEAVVRLLGGFEHVGVLASEPAMQLHDALAVPPTARLASRIIAALDLSSAKEEDVADALASANVIIELSSGSKSLKELRDGRLVDHKRELLPLIARLSEVGVVRRGFSLPCSHCGLTTWHPLASVGESVRCDGCGGTFHLPVELPANSEVQIHYVLNSLVNRALDQGVIPALLAMNYVARRHVASYCKASALEVFRGGVALGDLDFVLYAENRLVAGEAKTGSRLADKDYRGAEMAAEVGFGEFCFCTTASSFDSEAIRGVEALRERLAARSHEMAISVVAREDLLVGAGPRSGP